MVILSGSPRKYMVSHSTYKCEVKIKESDVDWENIDTFVVVDTETANMDEATEKINVLCNGLAKQIGKKVRWCFIGIEQGHYCHPKGYLSK